MSTSPIWSLYYRRFAACSETTGPSGSTWDRLTPLVIPRPAEFSVGGMLLHVAAMAQDFKVLRGLVPLVPISVMDAESPCPSATLALTSSLHYLFRSRRREPVIPSVWILRQHLQPFRFSALFRPPSRNLCSHLRPRARTAITVGLALQCSAQFLAMLGRALVGRSAPTAQLRSGRRTAGWARTLRGWHG